MFKMLALDLQEKYWEAIWLQEIPKHIDMHILSLEKYPRVKADDVILNTEPISFM